MFINLHTHRPAHPPNTLEIESVYFGQKGMASAPLRSVGLHPWHLDEVDLDQAAAWLKEQAALPGVIALGEAGLDKVCGTPWALQVAAFQRCAEVSETAGKPLIVHCVRAFSEAIALKKGWKPHQTWVFHGFDKNVPTAEMLLREGCCLSFGAGLFREGGRAAESLMATPAERLFLETDDGSKTVSAVYERAAMLRNTRLQALVEQVQANFGRVFGIRNPT